jgi:hypothetical protein
MDELPSIVLYRQPNIWAAAAGLVGVEINALSCLQPLNEAYFQQ